MNPVVLARRVFWGAVTVLVGVAAARAAFLVVRGPLLGGEVLAPGPLVLSSGVFVVGIIGFAFGGTKFVRAMRA